jgi:aspartate aminotransferase
MKLSQRIEAVSPSATIAITTRAKQLQADGVDVVSFAAGEPDFDTPAFIKEAAKAALDAGDTKYNPKQGKALLQAISDKIKRDSGLDIPADQIVVTFGGKHALYDAFQATVDPGDGVLIPAPYWVSYPEMVNLAGGTPIFLETSLETNFKITPQQILDNADKAKILVLNSPSNPTGVTYTRDELAALAEAVLQTDLMVFSDEIYENLIYGDTKFTCFATLDKRLEERTLIVNGLAKTFSMTGWRLGWAAGPKDIITGIRKLMSHETTNPVSFAQAGALAAYTDPQAADTIEAMRSEFEKRGKHMVARLNAMDGVSCCEPTGAFYCFPDVSAHFGRELGGKVVNGSLDLAAVALDEANIAVVPGVAFGQDKCIRLSFATSMEQIDKGLDRLEALLK